MQINDQKSSASEHFAEKLKQFDQRIEKLEKNTNNTNTCSNSNSNFTRRNTNSEFKWLKNTNNLFKSKDKRSKNVILFGLTQAATSTNEEDKKEVIKIFNSIGIVISNDSIDIERLNPKRNQSEPRPILVKLNSTNLSSKTIKRSD